MRTQTKVYQKALEKQCDTNQTKILFQGNCQFIYSKDFSQLKNLENGKE